VTRAPPRVRCDRTTRFDGDRGREPRPLHLDATSAPSAAALDKLARGSPLLLGSGRSVKEGVEWHAQLLPDDRLCMCGRKGGTASCRDAMLGDTQTGMRSRRVASVCPILMNVGPKAVSHARGRRPPAAGDGHRRRSPANARRRWSQTTRQRAPHEPTEVRRHAPERPRRASQGNLRGQGSG